CSGVSRLGVPGWPGAGGMVLVHHSPAPHGLFPGDVERPVRLWRGVWDRRVAVPEPGHLQRVARRIVCGHLPPRGAQWHPPGPLRLRRARSEKRLAEVLDGHGASPEAVSGPRRLPLHRRRGRRPRERVHALGVSDHVPHHLDPGVRPGDHRRAMEQGRGAVARPPSGPGRRPRCLLPALRAPGGGPAVRAQRGFHPVLHGALLALLAVYSIFPIYMVTIESLKSVDEDVFGSPFYVRHPSFEWYENLFEQTLLFLPLYHLVFRLHLDDRLGALVLTYPMLAIPFCVWLFSAYFQKLSPDIEESAYIEGANRFTAFLRIVLPMSWPVLVA